MRRFPFAVLLAVVATAACRKATPEPTLSDDAPVARLLLGSGNAGALELEATDPGVRFERGRLATFRFYESLRAEKTCQRPGLSIGIGPCDDAGAPQRHVDRRATPRVARVALKTPTSSQPIRSLTSSVGRLEDGFRRCYSRGLESDPGMSGKAVFVANVSSNGEVQGVHVLENAGLQELVLECIMGKIRRAEFDPPGDKGATVTLPVTFTVEQR